MEEIRIIELPAFQYLNFNGFGISPELEALGKLREWLEKNQSTIGPSRYFGFNNPDPAPGSDNYGYEVWVVIPEGKENLYADAKSFSGGLYAVSHCSGLLVDAEKFIPDAWKNLTAWLESSPYRLAHHQWLEEQLGSGKEDYLSLDLYMPIVK